MTRTPTILIAFAAVLTVAACGILTASGGPSFPQGRDIDPAVLLSVVGNCEKGSELLADGNACEKNAQTCSVLTTDFTIGVSLGISVSFDAKVPTGCDENDIDKPLCPGVVKYTVQGSGTVKKVEDKACDVLKKHLCQEVVRGTPWCVNIGTGGTVSQIVDWVVDNVNGVGGTEVTYDSSTGQLCIDSSYLKKCQKHTESDYSCGEVYPAEVQECTP